VTAPLVVSACYGGYDRFKPPPPGCSRAVMFTDRPHDAAALGWSVVSGANPSVPPRLRSKPPKCTPQLLLLDADEDVIWIDASLRSTGKDVRELLELVPVGGVGTFRHRFRETLLAEAIESAALPRYKDEPVIQQAQFYNNRPVFPRLWETGCVVWRGAQHTLGVRWLAECLTWSSQDQVSFPAAAAAVGAAVTTLPGTSVENRWLLWEQHAIVDWSA